MRTRHALTLIELVVVMFILTALACLLSPLLAGTMQSANEVATKRTLLEIRDALSDYWADTKFVTLDGFSTTADESERFELVWLFQNPVTGDTSLGFDLNSKIGWRGPYVRESTGSLLLSGTPFLIDAWNHEIIAQDVDHTASVRDVRILSAGPNGVVDTSAAIPSSSLTANDVGDDIYVTLTFR